MKHPNNLLKYNLFSLLRLLTFEYSQFTKKVLIASTIAGFLAEGVRDLTCPNHHKVDSLSLAICKSRGD